MEDKELLARIAPNKVNRHTLMLILSSSMVDRSGLLIFSDGSFDMAMGMESILNLSSKEIDDDSLIKEAIEQASVKGRLSALLWCKREWMFRAYVEDSEIADWGNRPIQEHPDAIDAFMFMGVTHTERVYWTVTLIDSSREGAPVINKVFEEERLEIIEEGLLPLTENQGSSFSLENGIKESNKHKLH